VNKQNFHSNSIHSKRARDSKPTNQNQNIMFRIKTHKPNQI
jgi:hypothetical protein